MSFIESFSDELMKISSYKIVELTSRKDKLKADILENEVFLRKPSRTLPKRYRYYGAYNGTDLVGMIRVNTDPLRAWKGSSDYVKLKKLKPDVAISALAVRPGSRRRGVAKALRAKLQEEFDSILTGVSPSESNVEAMRSLNRQMGFNKVLEGRNGNVQYHWRRRIL